MNHRSILALGRLSVLPPRDLLNLLLVNWTTIPKWDIHILVISSPAKLAWIKVKCWMRLVGPVQDQRNSVGMQNLVVETVFILQVVATCGSG